MPTTTYEFDALRGVGRVELCVQKDQRVYALFGSNGVGKTKCLEALFQFYLASCQTFADVVPEGIPLSAFVASRYSEWSGYLLLPPHSPRGEHDAVAENPVSSFCPKHQRPVVFLGAGQRSHVKSESSLNLPIGTFGLRRAHYLGSLVKAMTTNFSTLGMHAGLEEWFVTLAQSANPYQKQADNRKVEIDTLLQLLHQVDDRFDPAFLQIAGDNRVSVKVHGQVTELQHLSSGFASLLKMLQAIISGYANFTNEVQLAHVKGYVFIDEIESHLHSSWQAKIVPLLKKLFPHTTFFIATHSPVVLSQLQEGEAYLLKRMDDGVVRAEMVAAPNKRAFVDVLVDAFGVDLNALKRARLETEDQSEIKQQLLALLVATKGGE